MSSHNKPHAPITIKIGWMIIEVDFGPLDDVPQPRDTHTTSVIMSHQYELVCIICLDISARLKTCQLGSEHQKNHILCNFETFMNDISIFFTLTRFSVLWAFFLSLIFLPPFKQSFQETCLYDFFSKLSSGCMCSSYFLYNFV